MKSGKGQSGGVNVPARANDCVDDPNMLVGGLVQARIGNMCVDGIRTKELMKWLEKCRLVRVVRGHLWN